MLVEDTHSTAHESRFVIRPNCSLSWRGNQIFFLMMATVCFGIAGIFTARGYWVVLPFAGLEMAALGAALYLCAWRAARWEVITVERDHVEIAIGREKPEQTYTFNRHWARVELDAPAINSYPSRLVIRSHGREVEVGTFLSNEERRRLARALRAALSRSIPDLKLGS